MADRLLLIARILHSKCVDVFHFLRCRHIFLNVISWLQSSHWRNTLCSQSDTVLLRGAKFHGLFMRVHLKAILFWFESEFDFESQVIKSNPATHRVVCLIIKFLYPLSPALGLVGRGLHRGHRMLQVRMEMCSNGTQLSARLPCYPCALVFLQMKTVIVTGPLAIFALVWWSML